MKGSIENHKKSLKALEGKIIPNPGKGYNGDTTVLNRKKKKATKVHLIATGEHIKHWKRVTICSFKDTILQLVNASLAGFSLALK